jgi:hypothetical protein
MKTRLIVVDVEADGPAPGPYSMVCFGAVVVQDTMTYNTFYGKTAPISSKYIPDALAVSGFTRNQHEGFDAPSSTMDDFVLWLNNIKNKGYRVTFISDNPAFDWQFINYYLHVYAYSNPFGYSGRRIGDIFSGLEGNLSDHSSWKKYRRTKHDHNPVNDAIGNVESIITLIKKYNMNLGSVDIT